MDPINTSIEYLVDDPRFRTERPFAIHVDPSGEFNPENSNLNTVIWDEKPVTIYDVRHLKEVALEKQGFQNVACKFTPLQEALLHDEVVRYQIETERFLETLLGAEKVICYDCRVYSKLICHPVVSNNRSFGRMALLFRRETSLM